jgi:ubiquinone/menaquinone biosynthesis C-methylase UbiE
MIVAAKQLGAEKDGYILADVQDLSFLRDRSFDLAAFYLNLCDLPDFEANTREVFRVLKRGRRSIIVTLHPIRSAVGDRLKTQDGAKLQHDSARWGSADVQPAVRSTK